MKLILTFISIILMATAASAMPVKREVATVADEPVNPKLLEQAADLEAVLISTMIEPMFPRGKESGKNPVEQI